MEVLVDALQAPLRRRGAKKAILAVAVSLLDARYSMLRDGVGHRDLGPITSTASTAAGSSAGSCAASKTSAARWRSTRTPREASQ
jgi:hypothetical protein